MFLTINLEAKPAPRYSNTHLIYIETETLAPARCTPCESSRNYRQRAEYLSSSIIPDLFPPAAYFLRPFVLFYFCYLLARAD